MSNEMKTTGFELNICLSFSFFFLFFLFSFLVLFGGYEIVIRKKRDKAEAG